MKHLFTGAVCATIASLAASAPASAQETVQSVKCKGVVSCAANGGRQGMSSLDSQGKWVGMDVDVCRAVAAAVLGDCEAINMVKATTQTRFPMLQTGEADIVTANATWTLSRDGELGLNFTVTTFYDGQGFMVPKDLVSVMSLNWTVLICVCRRVQTLEKSPQMWPKRTISRSTRS